jgi:hypothetical protein
MAARAVRLTAVSTPQTRKGWDQVTEGPDTRHRFTATGVGSDPALEGQPQRL